MIWAHFDEYQISSAVLGGGVVIHMHVQHRWLALGVYRSMGVV